MCREEGSNGDREMAAAMWHAGLEPWDITMSDLLQGRASLDTFQGAAWANKGHAGQQHFVINTMCAMCLCSLRHARHAG